MAAAGAAPLNLQAVIGLSPAPGLLVAEGGANNDGHSATHIYALGSTVVLRDAADARAQEFLKGHTGRVSCLALSPSGRFLASGQLSYLGFPADIIVWDLAERRLLHRLQLQKVKVERLAFSPDEALLASLGGADDNSLVLWDVASGEPVCGAPTGADFVSCLAFLPPGSVGASDDGQLRLVTAGNYRLTVWAYDAASNRLQPTEARLGQLKRQFRCLAASGDGRACYAGSTSGDVMLVSLAADGGALLKNAGPAKAPLQLGVTALAEAPCGTCVVAGAGDGSVVLLSTACKPSPQNPKVAKKLPALAAARLEGAVTSIAIEPRSVRHVSPGRGGQRRGGAAAAGGGGSSGGGGGGGGGSPGAPAAAGGGVAWTAIVTTDRANVYRCSYDPLAAAAGGVPPPLTAELVQTAHAERVNGLAFPSGYGEVFATCAAGGVRVWHLQGGRELLRVRLPNLDCRCVAFTPDGKAIVTGWSDGRIRGFGPQSGKLLFTINDAHHKGVTALAATPDSARLVSGGEEGMVRVWRLAGGGGGGGAGRSGPQAAAATATMEASMKDHKGPVNAVVVRRGGGGDEAASASSDGSVIVWDLATGRRRVSLLGNTFFLGVAYSADEAQLVTGGTDRKLSYWDAFDGQAIRVIEDASTDAPVNAVAVVPGGGGGGGEEAGDASGDVLLTGGGDKLVKLWGFDEGLLRYVGVGHSGEVTAVAAAPGQAAIVSVGSEGGIFIWEAPPEMM